MLLRLLLLFYSLLVFLAVVNAEVSEACLDEITDIRNSPLVVIELGDMQASVTSIPFQNYCTLSETSLYCIVEYEEFVDAMKKVCNAANGQYIETEHKLACKKDGETYNVDYLNVPSCVGVSCEPSELDNQADGIFADFQKDLEDGGWACTTDGSVFDEEGNQLLGAEDSSMQHGVSSTLLLLMTLFWYGFV
jgi:hypothetical protein